MSNFAGATYPFYNIFGFPQNPFQIFYQQTPNFQNYTPNGQFSMNPTLYYASTNAHDNSRTNAV
jgi:hypothetical protein